MNMFEALKNKPFPQTLGDALKEKGNIGVRLRSLQRQVRVDAVRKEETILRERVLVLDSIIQMYLTQAHCKARLEEYKTRMKLL